MTDRGLLEDRRRQALRDLRDVERQVEAGELDAGTAEHLTRVYEAEVVRAAEAIAALTIAALNGPPADDTDGGGPPGTTGPGRSRRRVLVGAGTMLLACGLVAFLVTRALQPRPPGGYVTGGVASPSGQGVDLSQVTDEQMEQVLAQHPGVVRMRLALAKRYLLDHKELAKARDHARVALEQQPGPANRHDALWVLGWATVALGQPQEGATFLRQSVDLDPAEPTAVFFLAVTELEYLHDPAAAVPLFERLLAHPERLTTEERQAIREALDDARRQVTGRQASDTTTAP